MKPSTMTALLSEATPRMRPAMAPISKPPTLESTSIGSDTSGLFKLRAFSITDTLCRNWTSSIPVPRPVTFSTECPVSTDVIALLGVVLPIPISPTPKMSYFSARFSAISIPASIEALACSGVIAGPSLRLLVPGPIRFEMI